MRQLQTRHAGDVSTIYIVDEREKLPFTLQFEGGVQREKTFHHFSVLLRLKTASAVNQRATGLQQRSSATQQIELSFAETFDFLRTDAPAQVHAATQDTGI